jgi:hypothetical protein
MTNEAMMIHPSQPAEPSRQPLKDPPPQRPMQPPPADPEEDRPLQDPVTPDRDIPRANVGAR